MPMTENRYVEPDQLVWPWGIDTSDNRFKYVKIKLKETGIDLSYYDQIQEGSKEYKVCSHIMKSIAVDAEHTWLMAGCKHVDPLFHYAHRIAALFAYSTFGSVKIFHPSETPQLLDHDPDDEEVFYLWKGMLLILINGTLPLSKKYRQTQLNNLLMSRAAKNLKVLWLDTHMPRKDETSDKIFENKISLLMETMPSVASKLYNSGSFLWLKTAEPKEFSCDAMEG